MPPATAVETGTAAMHHPDFFPKYPPLPAAMRKPAALNTLAKDEPKERTAGHKARTKGISLSPEALQHLTSLVELVEARYGVTLNNSGGVRVAVEVARMELQRAMNAHEQDPEGDERHYFEMLKTKVRGAKLKHGGHRNGR